MPKIQYVLHFRCLTYCDEGINKQVWLEVDIDIVKGSFSSDLKSKKMRVLMLDDRTDFKL